MVKSLYIAVTASRLLIGWGVLPPADAGGYPLSPLRGC